MPSAVDMLFPPTTRVVYAHAPLVHVIAQVRFPSLLRIESEPPAAFQEAIRAAFPLLERSAPSLSPNLTPEILKQLGVIVPGVAYQFLTEDRKTTLSLAPDALSLSTSAYTRWEDFRHQLSAPLEALISIYQPSFFTRIGLRYIDVIDRRPLGLEATPWSQLLRPELLGEAALPQFEQNLEDVKRVVRVRRNDGRGSVLLQHGFGIVQSQPNDTYAIDFDIYLDEKTECRRAQSTLDQFNDRARRAFRWAISDRLHDALEPSAIPLAAAVGV